MFFATNAPAQFRRPTAAQGSPLERFMDEALRPSRNQACAYTQDETAFSLSLDVPGIAKDQLGIAIEGAVVRITSKEGATRQYRAAYELPQDIDAALSTAKLENGVLSLTLAKKVPVSNASELVVQ
ncbi:MAG: hypothetical protein RIR09_2689 [Pseudomonadota bacterium]|jgi:HSP20 family molecular chaperone IbpA